MKIQFRILGLQVNTALRACLQQRLEQLQRLVPVSTAEVALQRQPESAPSVWAHVHLAVPGPDIHAAARDHTLAAAWLKVVEKLERQIKARQARQRDRLESRRAAPLSHGTWSGAMAGQRA